MKRFVLFMALVCLFSFKGFTQQPADTSIFSRIKEVASTYKVDTSTPPGDRITAKIIELRNLRGGFNVNEFIQFKIAEDREKNEAAPDKLDQLAAFFTTGNGRRWLDNAVVWIYRQHFSYKELKQLVRFYKTTAGEKLAGNFPLILLQSVMAMEMIKDYGMPQPKN